MIPADIVYFVRDGDYNEELRFSLRSVAKNVPHKRIWIVGYTPKWVRNVKSVRGNLQGSKWLNVLDNLRLICEKVDAEQFVVMNDDFFVTQAVDALPALRRGETLIEHIAHVKGHGSWRDSLLATMKMLRELGYQDPLSYELHVPVIMERAKLAEVVKVAEQVKGNPPQWRTLYGNMHSVEAIVAKDNKVSRRRQKYSEGSFESSDESTFNVLLKPKMEALFPDRCEYEESGGTIARVNYTGDPDMTTYRTTVYPALMVRVFDRNFKFVGGRLRVRDAEDEKAMDDFVASHPQYHIYKTERDVSPKPVIIEQPQPTAVPNSLKPTLGELRDALRAQGLPVTGTRDQLEERLAAAYEDEAS